MPAIVLAEAEIRTLEIGDDEVDIRIFKADGDTLLLGFACDEGQSIAEEATAHSLAEDGIEVWMPDMLGGYMLPKTRSSIYSIPSEGLYAVMDNAMATGKQVFLIASGPDTELVLRVANEWEARHDGAAGLAGVILMFPRLGEGKPEPGKEPVYVEAVGKTREVPLLVFEGERTPNRWGIKHLTAALAKGGSHVHAKLIPDVRGYFFKRQDANMPEEVVTTQLAGLIKASLFFLGRTE
ncbi:MAG: hypothetical protein P8Z78_04540 [Gammaproteobacteria bacterium]